MPAQAPLRPLLLHAALILALAALAFLAAAQFFSAWDGRVVGVLPSESEDAPTHRVLVVEERGDRVLRWPTRVVTGLDLPVNATGIPPNRVPDEAPATRKPRFSLYFLVQDKEGAHRIVPTTSPFAVALAAVVAVVGLLVRNMAVAGTPFEFASRPTVLPAPLPPAGQPVPPKGSRPQKGPPPPRGKRRRR